MGRAGGPSALGRCGAGAGCVFAERGALCLPGAGAGGGQSCPQGQQSQSLRPCWQDDVGSSWRVWPPGGLWVCDFTPQARAQWASTGTDLQACTRKGRIGVSSGPCPPRSLGSGCWRAGRRHMGRAPRPGSGRGGWELRRSGRWPPECGAGRVGRSAVGRGCGLACATCHTWRERLLIVRRAVPWCCKRVSVHAIWTAGPASPPLWLPARCQPQEGQRWRRGSPTPAPSPWTAPRRRASWGESEALGAWP